MVVYEKIYLEAYINKEYICLKNDIAPLYFPLEKATTKGCPLILTDFI